MKTNPLRLSKNSYSAPVLKIIRKWNAYEKGNVCFKVFWPQVIGGFFIIATFFYNFYRLLENIQCFYHLPKLKSMTLKVSMTKIVYKIFKILCFDLKYYVPHKLHLLRYKFQNFPAFWLCFYHFKWHTLKKIRKLLLLRAGSFWAIAFIVTRMPN